MALHTEFTEIRESSIGIEYHLFSIRVENRDRQMDRLTTISASFFMAADIFAIVSLATPDWIVTDVGGNKNGLLFH